MGRYKNNDLYDLRGRTDFNAVSDRIPYDAARSSDTRQFLFSIGQPLKIERELPVFM